MIRRGLVTGLGLLLAACSAAPSVPRVSVTTSSEPLQAQPGATRSEATPAPGTVAGGQQRSTAPAFAPHQVLVSLAEGQEPPLDLGAYGQARLERTLNFTHPVVLLTLPDGLDVEAARSLIAGKAGVLAVSPNYLAPTRMAAPPANDPYLASQWPYGPDRADVYGAWNLIDSLTASDSRLARTTVAVIDSGVDSNHPDLNVLPGFDEVAPVVAGRVATGSFDNKADDHGTACAGVVGARRGNGLGAAGVAPGVAILPIKDTDASGSAATVADVLFGLQIAGYYNRSDSPYANLSNPAAGKVRVVSISWGYPTLVAQLEAFDSAFEFLRQRGIVVCCAAGNDGATGAVIAPANSPGAIAVSATMDYLGWELLAPYSSHGPEIWVAGPGNFIWTTAKKGTDADYSRAYQLFNGTSAATPFVAGVAALINARYGSAAADQDTAAWADRVKTRLATSADDLGEPGVDSLYGHGRVDARRAIEGELP